MRFDKKMKLRVVLTTLSITMIFMGGGCTNKQTQNTTSPTPTSAPAVHSASMLVADNSTFSNVQVYSEPNGLVWVPLEETSSSMDYELHFANGSFSIGGTDPIYSVKVNQTQALAGDKPIELPQAPRYFEHKPYMTTQALSTLIGTPVNWNAQNSQVVFTPINDASLSEKQLGSSSAEQVQSLSANSVNKSNLISYAQNFLGTPYKFSAGPYDRTHTFDCSSFVQYVYAHFGVKLPRSSRSQAQVGQTITINNLQPGDLMFFYTPGRFASNRIVGHVGIYAGNGQIVHTYGQPGVTVTQFNKYWRGRFLFAKRVA
jgi:cell wall-associated NlpC family hydrolase